MGELPHLKALVERHADKPFAVVGVNTDRDKSEYQEKAARYGVTWRSSWQGSTAGPWPTQWGVNSYPTVFVLDAEHRIRYLNARGKSLDDAVDELLAELEGSEPARGGQ